MGGYEAGDDPYVIPGSLVLKNRLGLTEQADLDAFEAISVTQRSEEPLPEGRFTPAHYFAVHRHLFQDVYPWAGKPRSVRTGKAGAWFCFPENIAGELKRVFAELKAQNFLRDLTAAAFAARGAYFLSELNAIHPFREGNGRAQSAFFALLAAKAGHPLDFDKLRPDAFLEAMVYSFGADTGPLEAQILDLIT